MFNTHLGNLWKLKLSKINRHVYSLATLLNACRVWTLFGTIISKTNILTNTTVWMKTFLYAEWQWCAQFIQEEPRKRCLAFMMPLECLGFFPRFPSKVATCLIGNWKALLVVATPSSPQNKILYILYNKPCFSQ